MIPILLRSIIACPRCGSTLTYVNPDGDMGCAACGNVKYTLTPTIEREYKRRVPKKDVTRGQGLTAAVALRIGKAIGVISG